MAKTINAEAYQKLLKKYWTQEAIEQAVLQKLWPSSDEYIALVSYWNKLKTPTNSPWDSSMRDVWNAWDNIKTSRATNSDFPSWLNPNLNPNNTSTQTQTTTQPTPQPTPQPTSQPATEAINQNQIDNYQTNFDSSWTKFIEESKNAYWLETAQQLERYKREWMDLQTAQNKLMTQYWWQEQDLSTRYSQSLTQYDWQTQNLNTQLARNQADYATYTSQNQQDFNYNIAQQNKDYSKALSSAFSAYWQRGILKSWIAKQQAQEATQEFANEQAYFKTMNQRKLDEASLSLGRATEDINKNLWQLGTQKGWTTQEYNTNQSRLWTQKGWSATDYTTQTGRLAEDRTTLERSRQAWSDVLWINLQAQWDMVYNQWMQQYYQLLQAQKEQEAINKIYWTSTTATKIPYRVWGKYTL